jgi:hypothetical protein
MAVEFVSHVWIDGTHNPYPGGAPEYERQVSSVLSTVRATATGRTLLSFFALRRHNVRIIPPGGSFSPVHANADTGSVNEVAAFRRNFEVRSGLDGRVDPRGLRGTGAGSDSRVRFHPIHWNVAGGFHTPDEVLLHELFHAMRQTFGALRNTPLDGDFDTVEEVYSIFVENMYASERKLPLRATHHSASSNMSPDHSMAHNPRFHAPMRDLSAMMPTIVNALARVNTAYNPFRDWIEFSQQQQHDRR